MESQKAPQVKKVCHQIEILKMILIMKGSINLNIAMKQHI